MLSAEQLTKLATALGGLPVLGTHPGSPAALAGIRYGDIVLSVNGVPTPDWSAYIEARALKAGGMSVELFRGGEELKIELRYEVSDGTELRAWLASLGGEPKPEPEPS